MDLKEFFAIQARETAIALKTDSPTIKKLVSQRNKKNELGTSAIFSFDGFKIMISYIEQGKSAYAQQTIWVSFSLECDRSIPFSLYDILAHTDPDNFNCYTYTYVDSKQLMADCFGELTEILKKTVPLLSEILENGITKNKLLSSQKDNINKYFGDSVLESADMIGGAADKIISMMLQNFYEAQIESAVLGAQALFYNGKDEKALKRLKKSKHKTYYEENLLRFLENGGTSKNISETAHKASADKGALRHGGGAKGAFRLLGLTALFSIPVIAGAMGIFALLYIWLFRGNAFTVGIKENLLIIPFFCFLLAFTIALRFATPKKKNNGNGNDTETVHSPKATGFSKEALKYFTVFAECLAIIGCITSLFSVTVFYDNSFKYAEEDFPFSQAVCDYSAIELIGIIDGYYYEDEFIEKQHIAFKTISGKAIDLYNSTWLSSEDFLEKEKFFKEKGIEIKHFKTYNDFENE